MQHSAAWASWCQGSGCVFRFKELHRRFYPLETVQGNCICLCHPTASSYLQTNLVSDQPGAANLLQPLLVNPWGLDAAPTGPWWISDNGSNSSTLHRADGTPPGLVKIAVPGPPTGIVAQTGTGFIVKGTSSIARFIFAVEDGTVAAWANPLTTAVTEIDNSGSGAVYKGIAISGASIFVTNFFSGSVEQYDSTWKLVRTFTDPTIPAGYAPFGIQQISGKLYVTYAVQDPDRHDDVAGAGNGLVSIFDVNGNFVGRFVTGGVLNSPWGLALAPSNFGAFSGALLVGNFGDGLINAFNPSTGALLGALADACGRPLSIDGLWAIRFGFGNINNGNTNDLYFTAGPNDESNGFFGFLRPTA